EGFCAHGVSFSFKVIRCPNLSLWTGAPCRKMRRCLTVSFHVTCSEKVLGVVHSSGLDDPGPVRWELALCLLAAWIIIFLCMLKGIHSSGKVVYFTATFPYFVIIVLLIRGATLEGSIDGVKFYLTADWKRLQSAQVWNDAASQIFYSLGIGFGGLLSMASYNKFDNNVISFFAGFAIFSVLGHMAWKKGVPVGEVADSGPGLAFVAYPEALALLPGSVFWSILFFLMLFTLGVDTLFGNMEGITTAILDEIPSLRDWKKKTIFLGILCFCFYLLGLLLITQGGIYWFTLIDSYSTSFGLIIIALFMCLGISFFYACWAFITPLLLLFILFYIFLEMYNTPLHYGSYEYPHWGKALGICMGTLCCIQIPIWATVAVFRETGTLKDRFKKSLRPLNTWRNANSPQEHSSAIIDVPYTVNLTEQDFSDAVWQGAGMLEH
ncbi:hypothetical protein XELAEV_18013960mg, partial [Xenopus laevis]